MQVFYGFNHFINGLIVKVRLIFPETIGRESGLHLEEAETAAQSIVNHCQTAVGCIHHANDVYILGNRKIIACLSQFDILPPITVLYKHKQLAKNLAQITPVDFIDDKEIFLVRITLCFLAEVVKNARL